MKPLQMISQKTAVLDEKESRNSIRPVLEEAGFSMEYNDISRILSVFDANKNVANIMWIKGIEDFRRRSLYTPISWVGSDLWEEIYWNRSMVEKVLQTWIWACNLEYLLPNWTDYISPLANIDIVFTKYPEYLKKVIFEFYTTLIEEWWDAPELSPKFVELLDLCWSIDQKVKYSDSPDTTLADMSGIWLRENFAWWEVVQTWNSTRSLWLTRVKDQKLIRQVSTDIYANKNISWRVKSQLDFFIKKIDEAL